MTRLVHVPTGRECRLEVRGRTFTLVTRFLGEYAPGIRPKTELQLAGSAGEAEALARATVQRLLGEDWCEVPEAHGRVGADGCEVPEAHGRVGADGCEVPGARGRVGEDGCEVTGATGLVERLGALEPWATGLRIAREPSALVEAWAGLGEERLLRELVRRVTRVEVGEGGLELELGAHTLSVAWPLHPELLARVPASLRPLLSVTGALWLDEDRVMAGWDFGPPEGDAELEGSELEGAEVTWFLTVGTERFWLAEGERLFRYELDGGLSEEPGARAAARVLEEVLAGTKVPSGE